MDYQPEEAAILAAIECITAAAQNEGSVVCQFDDLKDGQNLENFALEGLDVVAAIRAFKHYIAEMIRKLQLYIIKTYNTFFIAGDYDIKKAGQIARLLSSYDQKDPTNIKFVNRNMNLVLGTILVSNLTYSSIVDVSLSSIIPEDINEYLRSWGVDELDIDITKGDYIKGISISNIKSSGITFAFITGADKHGYVTVDMSRARHIGNIMRAISELLPITDEMIKDIFDMLDEQANALSSELGKMKPENMSTQRFSDLKMLIGFKLSLVTKQVSMIRVMANTQRRIANNMIRQK